jgi:hypothetical protein
MTEEAVMMTEEAVEQQIQRHCRLLRQATLVIEGTS